MLFQYNDIVYKKLSQHYIYEQEQFHSSSILNA